METKIYEKLKSPIGNFNELKIKVDYALGGMNYFSGGITRRGIYLYLTPVSRGGGIESSVLMGNERDSGYKILLEELSRKNQKKIEVQFNKVKGWSKKIAKLYSEEKDQEIHKLINS